LPAIPSGYCNTLEKLRIASNRWSFLLPIDRQK
jgi:hypothetical protein